MIYKGSFLLKNKRHITSREFLFAKRRGEELENKV